MSQNTAPTGLNNSLNNSLKDGKTALISKERLKYLEYLEKNVAAIVDNAVADIIKNEKQKTKKPHDTQCSTITCVCSL